MWRYIIQRLLALVPVVLIVSIAAFAFIHFLPGDPVIALIGPEAGTATPETIAARKRDLGLDRPLPVQYLDWLGSAVRGDLGQSAVTKQKITEALQDRFPVTLHLAVASFLVAISIALPTGIISAYKRNGPLDRVLTSLALTGVAMPSFWLGHPPDSPVRGPVAVASAVRVWFDHHRPHRLPPPSHSPGDFARHGAGRRDHAAGPLQPPRSAP